MITNTIIKFIGSQLFSNLLLLITVLVAFFVGYKQILLNDVIEIYVTTNANQTQLILQNVGTRLIYLDKYVFNGSEYITNGQILPSTYSQADGGFYWIKLPDPRTQPHVSLVVYYQDLDNRHWKSEVIADFVDNSWKTSSFKRIEL